MVLGDARLSLARAPAARYGLIVADAFSSDAIPIHLLIRESLALYRSKLRRDGVLAFHISNRYLALEPVMGALAHDAGLACVAQKDERSQDDGRPETDASDWVVMAKRPRDLAAVPPSRGGWRDCRHPPATPVWTDDFSNLFGAVDLDG